MDCLLVELQIEIASRLDVEDCTALICVGTTWQAVVNSRPVLSGLKARYNLQLEDNFSILLRDYDKRYLTRRCHKYRTKIDCLLYSIKYCPEKELDFEELVDELKTFRDSSHLICGRLAKHGYDQTILRLAKCQGLDIHWWEHSLIAGVVKCKEEGAKRRIEKLIGDKQSLARAQAEEDAFQGRWDLIANHETRISLVVFVLRGFAKAGNVQDFLRFVRLCFGASGKEPLQTLFSHSPVSNFMYEAVESGCLEMVLLIEKFYAAFDIFHVCSKAAKQGDLAIFRLLFKKYKKQASKEIVIEYTNSCIIDEAIKFGSTEIINYLLKKDYINHQRALRVAIMEGRLDYINLFIEHAKTSQAVFEGYAKKTNLFDAEMRRLLLESRFPELLPYIKT